MLTNEDFNRLSNMLDQKLEKTLDRKLDEKLGETLDQKLEKTLDRKLDEKLGETLDHKLEKTLDRKLDEKLGETLDQKLDQKLDEKLDEKLGYMMQAIDQKFDAQAKMFDAKLGLLEYNFKEEIRKVNVRIDMLDEKLTNKIEEVDARLSARMDKLDSRMDGLESRMDRLENRMDKLDSRMDGLESGMDKLEKRVDNMDGRFSTRLDNLEDKVTSMDRTIRHDIIPQLAIVSSICAEAMEGYYPLQLLPRQSRRFLDDRPYHIDHRPDHQQTGRNRTGHQKRLTADLCSIPKFTAEQSLHRIVDVIPRHQRNHPRDDKNSRGLLKDPGADIAEQSHQAGSDKTADYSRSVIIQADLIAGPGQPSDDHADRKMF